MRFEQKFLYGGSYFCYKMILHKLFIDVNKGSEPDEAKSQ
jgi:hypothetical protein